jgi:hypothetical protein
VRSRFPHGKAGLGLALLRITLATMLAGFGLKHDYLSLPPITMVVPAFAIASLCVGWVTAWIASLFCVGVLLATYLVPGNPVEGRTIVSAVSLSVALAGAGAYSVDSLRQGQSVRVFPPED